MPAVFFLWFQMKENGRIWLTKAVQYASFYHASRRRSLDAASDSVRPLTTNGCDESRLMANWLKGQNVEIERVLVSPFLRAEQTLESRGLSEPAFQRSSAGVNTLRRCWSGQCLFAGVDQ